MSVQEPRGRGSSGARGGTLRHGECARTSRAGQQPFGGKSQAW